MAFKIRDAHWEIMMTFFEAHPEVPVGRFNGPNGREKQKMLWKELAGQLNAVGAGERSVDKWQKTWTDYKYLLKKKGSTLKKDQLETGGGPAASTPFNKFELRALNILGKTFFEGVGASEIAVTQTAPNTESNEKVSFRNPNYKDLPSTSTLEHDYSYSPLRKKPKKSHGIEEAYSETIIILKDIKNTIDIRLREISNSLNKLTESLNAISK